MLINIRPRYLFNKFDIYYSDFQLTDTKDMHYYLFDDKEELVDIVLDIIKHCLFKLCYVRR